MSTRIAAAFERCRAQGRAALIGYLTGYDPDRAGSLARLIAACEAGLDVLELGVPFSDPTADGPEIQAAMVRARAAGATLEGVLELAAALRERFAELPIVLFSYANPLLRGLQRDADFSTPSGRTRSARLRLRAPTPSLRSGPRSDPPADFFSRLAAIGIDGVLIVDLPPEHAASLRDPARAAGLDWIGLVAPTSTPARRERVLAHASGFVYAVSLTGVTGSALDANSDALQAQIDELRQQTTLPIAVGFGIREPEQVAALAPRVDAVVVGSALVRAGRDDVSSLVSTVAGLRSATRREANHSPA